MSTVQWTVEFAYLLEANKISPIETFQIEATKDEVTFEGSASDAEYEQLAGEKPQIEGIIQDEHIRFTKTYPHYYGSDENGKLFLDKTIPGHSVVYEGEWYEPKKHYEGDWFIEWIDEDGEVYHITGPWEMKASK